MGEIETFAALGLYENIRTDSTQSKPRVLQLFASFLERRIEKKESSYEGSRKKEEEEVITVFHGSRTPSLSIRQYIERVYKYSKCSGSCFAIACIYIERFLHRMDGFVLTYLNVHRLLITTIMIAAKFLDDECYNNAYYAKVGGVSTTEMNRMEMKLLFNLDFRLQVTVEVFRNYCMKLEREGGGGRYLQIRSPIYVIPSSTPSPEEDCRNTTYHTQNVSTTFAGYSRRSVNWRCS